MDEKEITELREVLRQDREEFYTNRNQIWKPQNINDWLKLGGTLIGILMTVLVLHAYMSAEFKANREHREAHGHEGLLADVVGLEFRVQNLEREGEKTKLNTTALSEIKSDVRVISQSIKNLEKQNEDLKKQLRDK